MKKKFIYSFLMVALLTTVVGTVVSCKDTDEDWNAYTQGRLDENASISEALQAQIDALRTTLGVVESEEGVLNGLIGDLQKEIDANTSSIEANTSSIDANSKAISNNSTLIQQNSSDIQSNLALIKQNASDIAENSDLIAQNASDILTLQSQVATAEGMLEVLNDAKEKIDEALNANGFEDMNALAAEVVGIMDAYTDLSEVVYSNYDEIQTLKATVSNLDEQVVAFGTTLDQVSGKLDDVSNTVDEHTETIASLLTDVAKANELAKADSIRIDEVNATVGELSESLETVSGTLETVSTTLETLSGTVDGLSESMTSVLQRLGDAEDDISDIKDRLDDVEQGLQDVNDELVKIREEAEANLTEAKEYAAGLIEVLKGDDFTYNTIGEFQTAVDEALSEYDAEISDLKERVETLEGEMLTVEGQINDLLKLTSYLQDYLSKQVTSILVQGTDNPIFGTFALPMNINSNVLAAFYGVAEREVHFPTSRETFYCDAEQCLSVADLEMLGVSGGDVDLDEGDILLLNKEGNAGTLYVTLNPNTVDFSGFKFGIENSIEEPAMVELGKLTPSDQKLSFGYTRSVTNGFYEAPATINKETFEGGDLDMGVVVEEMKDLITQVEDYVRGGSLNVTSILSTLYQQLTDVLDANAVYAEWTDEEKVAHRTYSQYSLAATAVKPLSYSFMIDTEYETFPGIGRVESLINDMFEKIDIPTFDLSDYNLDKVDHIEVSGDDVTFSASIRMKTADLFAGQTVTVTDDNGNVIGTGTWDGSSEYLYIDIEITMSQEDLYGETIDDINSIIDSLNDALDSINEALQELEKINDLGSALTDIQEQLISYIDRLNGWLCKMINSVNSTLQPILLVNTSDGFVKLSQMRSSPTVLSSGNGITLIPTSFTAEILAPAYKKMVGVTNVYSLDLGASAQDGDSDCLSALNSANGSGNMCKTLDGDTRSVSVSNLKSGYIYEVVYTAVDYSGKVAAQKFYVRVN